ncbi:hypothetical protein CBS101457_005027 [Exobasidium rhododendri]|nr:hypothetical protein CBS101457_005027 [Exobasidium rhododendri]
MGITFKRHNKIKEKGQQHDEKAVDPVKAAQEPVVHSAKPWLASKRRRRADRKVYWTFCTIATVLGLGSVAALIVTAILSLPKTHKYCLVLDEEFEGTELNQDVWAHEKQTGGWGTGEFEWTTDSTNNSFVKDGSLYIVPTLTSDSVGEAAIIDGYSLNLTSTNQCTSANKSDFYCAVRSNSSTQTILPPVQSARLTTKISRKTIKYGKIEVTAKMPTGKWIWPAIWMMPLEEKYGPWPASGEIDIFESKGNPSQKRGDFLSSGMLSTLHWGPLPAFDMYTLTHGSLNLFRNFFNQKTHTIGMVWDEEGITTWQQSRAHEVFSYKFGDKTFWGEGDFPSSLTNGTVLNNPWTASSGATNLNAAPFDQDFYLILSVAVGSTNGYFDDSDDAEGTPWSDKSVNPVRDFWASKDKWLPSWPANVEDRAMVVDSVKIWQQC